MQPRRHILLDRQAVPVHGGQAGAWVFIKDLPKPLRPTVRRWLAVQEGQELGVQLPPTALSEFALLACLLESGLSNRAETEFKVRRAEHSSEFETLKS